MTDIVFWSGGEDSTLVALELLRAGKDINLITIPNYQIGTESIQDKEKLVRKKCLQKLKTEFGNQVNHKEFLFDGDCKIGPLGQASIWLSMYPLCADDGDTIHLGFIRYSDFWHYRHRFMTAFNAICDFHNKKVKITFPLEWVKKPDIREKLKRFGYIDFTYHSTENEKVDLVKVTVK